MATSAIKYLSDPDDSDIVNTAANYPDFGVLSFERVRQDRRTYYRNLHNGKGGGSLTDATHARETIAYWRSKGWIK